MKTIITLLLLSITSIVIGRGDSINIFKSKPVYNLNTQKINLKLIMYKDNSSSNDIKTGGLILMVAGVVFTTASILEGNYNYGTWSKNPQPGNSYNQTYKTKPFIQQFPRNIMLVAGVGLTLTGGGIVISNK